MPEGEGEVEAAACRSDWAVVSVTYKVRKLINARQADKEGVQIMHNSLGVNSVRDWLDAAPKCTSVESPINNN